MDNNAMELKDAPAEQNKNGYHYPKNTWGKWIFGALLPLIVFLLGSVVAGAAFGVYGAIAYAGDVNAMTQFLTETGTLMVLAQNVITIAILVPIYFSQKKKGWYPPAGCKLNFADFIVYGVLLILGFSNLIGAGITFIFELLVINDTVWETTSGMLQSGSILMQILAVGISAPFAEEFVFRGILQQRLTSKLPKWAALLIASAVFGIFHGNATQFINAFLAGLLIGFMYMKTGSLWLCIIAHMANNIFSVIYEPVGLVNVPDAVVLPICACAVAFAVFYNVKLKKRTAAANTQTE